MCIRDRANTGITAIIDANGKLVEKLSVNKSGYLDSFVPSRKQNTIYGLYGDLIFLSLLLLTVVIAFLNKKFINQKDFKTANDQAKSILTLPIHQYLSKKQLKFISQKITDFYKKNKN